MIKIILIIIICLNSGYLKAIDRVIENIRISDSKENKASRIVFDLSKKMTLIRKFLKIYKYLLYSYIYTRD